MYAAHLNNEDKLGPVNWQSLRLTECWSTLKALSHTALTGVVAEDVSLKPNSTLILKNATVKGAITGDKSTTVKTVGQVSLEGNVTCGNLSLG